MSNIVEFVERIIIIVVCSLKNVYGFANCIVNFKMNERCVFENNNTIGIFNFW